MKVCSCPRDWEWWQNQSIMAVKEKLKEERCWRERNQWKEIRAAASMKDHLSYFPQFRRYHKNGLCIHMESGRGNKLSLCAKRYVQDLLKLNMEAHYGPEWPEEEKIKRREMVSEEARYIFVHEISNKDFNKVSEIMGKSHTRNFRGPIIGFVHYRFIMEEEVPVVYVYELQLEPRVQGKGLGKILMQLLELIASENKMGAVVLTVQRANSPAMDFYIGKLRWLCFATPRSSRNIMHIYIPTCSDSPGPLPPNDFLKPVLFLPSIGTLHKKLAAAEAPVLFFLTA